jgi:hypothetical protein
VHCHQYWCSCHCLPYHVAQHLFPLIPHPPMIVQNHRKVRILGGWWRWQVWDASSWHDCSLIKWQAVTNLSFFHTEWSQSLLVNVQGAQENHIHPTWCKIQ